MAIEIICKKIHDGRRKAIEILEIEALGKNQLPSVYFEETPFLYKSKLVLKSPPDGQPFEIDCLVCCVQDDLFTTLKVGDVYSKDFFSEHILPVLYEAGNKLGEINKKLRSEPDEVCKDTLHKQKRPWRGAVKVTI